MINSVRQKRQLPVLGSVDSVKDLLGGILSAVNCLLKDLIVILKSLVGSLGPALNPIIVALDDLVGCVNTAAQKITGAPLDDCTTTTTLDGALKKFIINLLGAVLGAKLPEITLAVQALLSTTGLTTVLGLGGTIG